MPEDGADHFVLYKFTATGSGTLREVLDNDTESFQPQMGQFTYWTSMKPNIGAQFAVHVLGSKILF